MIFLFLTILSSLSIAVILRLNESRRGDRLVVAGANYSVAAVLGFALSSNLELESTGLLFGLLGGACFIAGFMVLMRAMGHVGMAVPASIARLSMVVPVVGAIAFYNEIPSAWQWIGIATGIGSFVLLGYAQRRPDAPDAFHVKSMVLLGLVFAVIGFNDFLMKIADESGIDTDRFLFYLFTTAAVLCWIGIAVQRRSVVRRDVVLGGILGVPNYFSSYFLLLALNDLPAGVVYPAVSAGGVVAASIAGLLIWKETHNRAGWIGITLAAIAVALLSM
jgi:drug/metabolite transporter (DMT)-like permease